MRIEWEHEHLFVSTIPAPGFPFSHHTAHLSPCHLYSLLENCENHLLSGLTYRIPTHSQPCSQSEHLKNENRDYVASLHRSFILPFASRVGYELLTTCSSPQGSPPLPPRPLLQHSRTFTNVPSWNTLPCPLTHVCSL